MAGNGFAGRRREDADDRELFHQQHPSTPPPRFSSPSRPRRRAAAENSFRSLTFGATASTLLQGLVWGALSVVAMSVYYGWIPAPAVGDDPQKWSNWEYTMAQLYFTEDNAMPALPEEGLVSPSQMLHFSEATLVVNALLAITSAGLMIAVRCGSKPGGTLAWVVAWSVAVMAVTTVDVVVAAAMVRDLLLLGEWTPPNPSTLDLDTLNLCPGAVLALALRAGVLLLANVFCMLLVIRRLHSLRKGSAGSTSRGDLSEPASATKTEGPLDGYLYPKGVERGGVHNPAFVSDDTEKPWRSFRPEQEQAEQREAGQGHRLNGFNGHDLGYSSKQEDSDDIASHLTWMEEVDKHVDVRVRRGHAEDRPPRHHRFGMFVEDLRSAEDRAQQPHRRGFLEDVPPPPPQQQQWRRGHADDRYANEKFPSGSLRGAFGPPSPGAAAASAPSGPVPLGYPQAPPALRLPRMPLQPPALPPPDYSPPARRRPNAGAADRALAEGRAGLRPVRQDRY